MPRKIGVSLNDSKVLLAKENFEKTRKSTHHKRKCFLGFDELFELFKNDCNNFEFIGQKAGVSKERIRQIYKEYFKDIFLHRSGGHKRQKMCTLKKWSQEAKELPEDGLIRKIVLEATSRNFSTNRIPMRIRVKKSGEQTYYQNKKIVGLKKRSLLINNKKCRLLLFTSVLKIGKHRYTATRFSPTFLKKYDFVIITQQTPDYPERVFIIPAEIIFEFAASLETRNLYVPLLKTPVYRNRPSKIDFWRYENAWHLIG